MDEHSLTPAMVADALLSFAEEELDWPSYGSFLNSYDVVAGETSYDVAGLGKVVIVDYHDYDSNKSYDGWTEEMFVVFDVQGTLYKATGTYTSYTGSEWNDELKVVVPTEKTIVVFEEPK